MTKITAKKLARLSSAAYKKHTVAADNTEVLIRDIGPITVFAFRGTTFDGIDIIRDIRALPRWSGEIQGWAHRGFLKGVRAIWPLLPIGVPGGKPIALTGHSKGGAEAILCGAFMVGCGVPPVNITTFGAPRVGFGALKEMVKHIPGERHRLGADIVPTVPHRFPFPYRHDRLLTKHAVEDEHPFLNHQIADYLAAM